MSLVSESGYFDEGRHSTGGGLPTLLEVLRDAYQGHLADLALARKLAPDEAAAQALAAAKVGHAPLADFLGFAAAYLTRHRVVENFFVDANHGLVFSNQARCVVCPATRVAGTMQDAHDVPVTRGQGQPHLEGVVSHAGLPIR